jgi:hypothetical protein
VVPATVVAALLFVSTSCAAVTSTHTPSSPEASASAPAASPTESSPPAAAPTAVASPSPSSVTAPLAKLIITSLPFHAAEVGIAYAPVVLGAAGGKPPYKWSASSGALPTGLALSSDGKVSGTPSVAGAFSFVVRVGDSAGGAAGVGRSITVASHLKATGSCVATVCSVEQGCVTVCGGYGSQAGGVGPFKYVVTSGKLPPSTSLKGLSLGGTFTVVSKFSFAVRVTDSLGAIATVSANFSVFQHIAFTVAAAQCVSTVAPGCATQQLQYAYGNGTPNVVVTNINAPNYKNVMPAGFSAVAKAGTIYVSIPAQPNRGNWNGTITVKLVDQSPCGKGYNCSSGVATITVRI